MRLRLLITIPLALILVLASSGWAQEITGTIVGTVKDPTGAVVPNATVTITNTDKNVVIRTVQTNASGDYVAPLLPIGHYSISAAAGGFQKASQTGIELNVSARLTINLTLQVGGSTQEVSVEANPVQVELQSVAATGLVSGTQLRELSLNNRNYEQLVALQPGVTSTASDQLYVGAFNPLGTNTVSFSINGQRTSSNNWQVDGADNVDRGSNLTLLNYPSVDAIAEFKVLRGLYNAEYGRAGAGQINVVTKSGESRLHGGAYEFVRNDVFNANPYMNKHYADSKLFKPRPVLRYNNFGWTLGGPVYIPKIYPQKNKTFFFFSQEFRRMITYSPMFQGYVPTADEKAGKFVNATNLGVCVQINVATGKCATDTSGNPMIANSITNVNPVAAAYVKDVWSKVPLPNNTATDIHQLDQAYPNINNYRQELFKVDHVFGPKLTVFGRYVKDTIPTTEPRGLWTGGALPGVSNTKSDSPGKNIVARATATFSPTFLLETGYSYSYGAIVSRITGLISSANSPDISPLLKLPSTPSLTRIPTVNIGSYSAIAGFGPYDDYNRNHQVFANLTKVTGKQTLKWGGSYYHYQKTENAGGNNAGTYNFNATGADGVLPSTCYPTFSASCPYTNAQVNMVSYQQSWANFLLGNVSSFTQDSMDLTPDIRAHQFEAYGQDEWRIKPNLTLNFGLRYSLFRQPFDAGNMLTNFDPAVYDRTKAAVINPWTGNIVTATTTLADGTVLNPNPNYDPLNGILIAGKNSPYGNKVSNEQNHNFAPRIGVTWDPFGSGKTSIRTGYAMFYDTTLVGTVEQNIFTNKPYVSSATYNNGSFADPTTGTPRTSAAVLTPRSRVPVPYKTPYSQQWSFDVQQELGNGMLIDVGYYGANTRHLIGAIDINQPLPGDWRNHLNQLGLDSASLTLVARQANPNAAVVPDAATITSAYAPRLNAIRPFQGYGTISAIRNMFSSNYNSLQLGFQKKFHGNSMFNLAYTWSRSLTFNQTDRDTPAQNTYDVAAEYGLTQEDRPHVFTANFVYDLPFFRNQRGAVGHVLGGWEFSGIVTYQSGTPLTVTGAKTGDLAGQAGTVRPDLISNPNDGPKTFNQWFDTTAFADVPAGQFRPGSSGRGVVRGPGFGRWDISLFKNFKLAESMSMQFRAETFNLFNHTNFLGVNTTYGNNAFGQITGTRDPRIMQLGLKLNF